MIADIRSALRGYLLADAGIAALVGARVYPSKMPQGNTQDCIVYQRVSNSGYHHMTGPMGLARPRLQIDCWSRSSDRANALANLVKERIDGFKGSLDYDASTPPNQLQVRGIFFDTERDLYDEDSELYGVSRDYFVWVAEIG